MHLCGLILVLITVPKYPSFWALSFLAYTLGMRHAFDADHIAAIDNTVRLLVHQKKSSYGVGFFFSLGHSTVVFLMAIVVGISAKWAKVKLPLLEKIGGHVGTLVSGVFLIGIAIFNLLILIKLYRSFKANKKEISEKQLDKLLLSRGIITKFTAPLFRGINRSWQMYPIGFLFGLGFDTATEIALIALSATTAQTGTPLIGIIALPILFAAGMNIMDTTDSVMMSGAYSWAFDTPKRKAYYNIVVTTISVIAAFSIGIIELSNILSDLLNQKSGFINWIQSIDLNYLGYGLVITFVLLWTITYIFEQVKNKRNTLFQYEEKHQ